MIILEKKNNQSKFESFREKYVFFTYEKFEYEVNESRLSARFVFNMSDRYTFTPEFNVANDGFNWLKLNTDELDTLVFHIGMVELVSYWKTFCPKRVVIKPFALDKEQIEWWKKLYYNGLGEFFYLNSISVSKTDFMTIECASDKQFFKVSSDLTERCLIPVGGGKDSVVTLECLKDKMNCRPMIVNPRGASLECAHTAGYSDDDIIAISRSLDSTMLKLNAEGCLNGHTPFSALLAFFSILAGFGTSSKYIALSNESSANESTVPDSEINHQYSKSLEFETDFRNYVSKYINPEIRYFSFLRPLSEVQIAELFSRNEKYFKIFKSCNVGSKTDSWCCSCPKCLFTWMILSPFISQETLAGIFGSDVLRNFGLLHTLHQLEGTAAVKPFECVGTTGEVKSCISKLSEICDLKDTILSDSKFDDAVPIENYLNRFDDDNYLPDEFVQILKNKIAER